MSFENKMTWVISHTRRQRSAVSTPLESVPPAGKAFAIITLALQNVPEPSHRPIIYALAHTGHALGHTCPFQLCVESPVCILEPSVAVEQRMGVRIGCHCLVKGVKNQGVVVGIPDDEGYDAPVIEIQNITR